MRRLGESEEHVRRLRLLGGCELEVHGQVPEAMGYSKARALLGYLVLERGRPASRARLAELLWPDMPLSRGRNNLRRMLFVLRDALGEHDGVRPIAGDRQSVRLDPGFPLSVDFEQLDELLRGGAARLEPGEAVAAVGRLYRGRLLEGLEHVAGEDFLHWLGGVQDSLHRRVLAWLEHVALEPPGERPEAAEAAARLLVELAPEDERGYEAQMRLYAGQGRPARALRVFRDYRARLADHGREPAAVLRQLAEELERARGQDASCVPVTPVAGSSLARRRLTVLVADWGPAPVEGDGWEERMQRIARERQRGSDRLQQQGGHVVVAPDGRLFAYFGYPAAVEGGTYAACREALERVRGEAEVRPAVAVHTAWVVTGDDTLPDTMGNLTRLATDLVGHGAPGEVRVSDPVRERLGPAFRGEPVPGGGEPVAHRLTGLGSETLHSDAPLVGRQAALASLQRAWARARRRGLQRVLVSGEAGIGKTRLARELAGQLAAEADVVELTFEPHHRDSPLSVLQDHAERDRPDGDPCARAESDSLTGLLCQAAAGVPVTDGRRIEAAVSRMLFGGLRGAVLLLLDNLHWADRETLVLLDRLLPELGDRPVMVLATSRDRETPHWLDRDVWHVEPGGLSPDQALAMVDAMDAGQALSGEQKDRIVGRSEGVPLFVESLTRVWLERPEREQPDLPASVAELLTARLDQVAEARETLQAAAIIGRDFSLELLAAMNGRAVDAQGQELQQLTNAGVFRVRRSVAGDRYLFHHALLREAAYESLLPSERLEGHRRLVELLAERFSGEIEARPEWFAGHLFEAGLAREAVVQWLKAGNRATSLGAFDDALAHIDRATRALEACGDRRPEAEVVFELEMCRASVLIYRDGMGSSTLQASLREAMAIGERIPGAGERVDMLWAFWLMHFATNRWFEAERLAARMQAVAAASGDSGAAITAEHAVAITHYWRGQPREAARLFADHQRALDPAPMILQRIYSGGPRPITLGYLAMAEWFCGRVDEARRLADEATELARRNGSVNPLCMTLHFVMMLHRLMGEVDTVARLGAEMRALGESENLRLWALSGRIFGIWARAARGDVEVVPELHEALGEQSAVASDLGLSGTPIIDAFGQLGLWDEQLQLIDRALESSRASGACSLDAELRYQRGDALARLGYPAAAVGEEYRAALALAREQGMVMFEMRALVRLERRRCEQGHDFGPLLEELRRLLHALEPGASATEVADARRMLEAG